MSEMFLNLFRGNPNAHYVRGADGEYQAVDGEITIADIERHLRGEAPSVLSIPILPDGSCFFGALDLDRHLDSDPPVDHVALAIKITRLGLPLVLCRSKNPKSAHCWIFLKESMGIPAAVARRLLERYLQLLEISGEVEVFPKQETLAEGQKGNGINLPYHGTNRVAFGPNGEELSLAEFLELAQTRRSFGQLLEKRDLSAEPQASGSAPKNEFPPMTAKVIRDLCNKHVEELKKTVVNRNDALNKTCFFLGRAFSAKALERTESVVQDIIRRAALATGLPDREIATTMASAWSAGMQSPLEVLNWRERFHLGSELEEGDVKLYIDRILPEGITAIGSLPGIGKTFLALSMAKALTTGRPFLSVFAVPEIVPILYLVPEMGQRSLRKRLQKFDLLNNDNFYCQTMTDGVCHLQDPSLFDAVMELKPIVFLDTVIRFSRAQSENDASEHAKLLANDLFQLVKKGARSVVCLHHSPKASAEAEFMTAENVLRGSGDFAAMCDAVWGLQHDKRKKGRDWDWPYLEESQRITRLYVRCVKPRDFEPAEAFRIQGRPYIDDKGDWAILNDFETADQSDARKVTAAINANPHISRRAIRTMFGIGAPRLEKLLALEGWICENEVWNQTLVTAAQRGFF